MSIKNTYKILKKHYPKSRNIKSVYLNVIRTIRNQIKHDLIKNHNIKIQERNKINVLIRLFLDANNLPEPNKYLSLKDYVIKIYLDDDIDIIGRSDKRFYSSADWLDLRKRVFRKYGYKCMKCGLENKSNHIDHIKPRSLYPELELDFDNMQVLCANCNVLKSNKNSIDYRPKCESNPTR